MSMAVEEDIDRLLEGLSRHCACLKAETLPDEERLQVTDISDSLATLIMMLQPTYQPRKSLIHDLRTPLTVIIGFAEMMLDTNNLTPTQRHHVQWIYDDGKRVLAIINHRYG